MSNMAELAATEIFERYETWLGGAKHGNQDESSCRATIAAIIDKFMSQPELKKCIYCKSDGNRTLQIKQLERLYSKTIYSVSCLDCGNGEGMTLDGLADQVEINKKASAIWNAMM